MAAAGEAGVVWDEASLAEYVADPRAWVRAATGNPKARSAMTYKHKTGGADMAAYLASLGQ